MKQLQKMFLHEYQKDMVERICKQPKIALWLDLGLGKTIISLQAICKLIGEGSVKKALVIAPKTVTESVWKQESETWQLPLRVSVVTGNAKQREKALQVKKEKEQEMLEGGEKPKAKVGFGKEEKPKTKTNRLPF